MSTVSLSTSPALVLTLPAVAGGGYLTLRERQQALLSGFLLELSSGSVLLDLSLALFPVSFLLITPETSVFSPSLKAVKGEKARKLHRS